MIVVYTDVVSAMHTQLSNKFPKKKNLFSSLFFCVLIHKISDISLTFCNLSIRFISG